MDWITYWTNYEKEDLAVVYGRGKNRTLARFQRADDTCLHEGRDNAGPWLWIESHSRLHQLPIRKKPILSKEVTARCIAE